MKWIPSVIRNKEIRFKSYWLVKETFIKKDICILFFLIFASTARFFERCLFLIGGLVRTHKVMLIILVGKKLQRNVSSHHASEL